MRVAGGAAPVAWTPGNKLDYAEWASVGRRLGGLSRCSQWWIGDWVRYGSARWGERYATAARITGYDAHSLRNMVWVCSRFDPSRRRDNLTWSHHASVATLNPPEQDDWLDRAADERLSVSDLRTELRSARRQGALPPSPGDSSSTHAPRTVATADTVICPRCGQVIDAQAENPGT